MFNIIISYFTFFVCHLNAFAINAIQYYCHGSVVEARKEDLGAVMEQEPGGKMIWKLFILKQKHTKKKINTVELLTPSD